MVIDEPADLIPLIGIITAVLALLIWIVKAQIHMSKQFEKNGGSSIKDQLIRIENDNRYIRERLDAHIDQHGRDHQ